MTLIFLQSMKRSKGCSVPLLTSSGTVLTAMAWKRRCDQQAKPHVCHMSSERGVMSMSAEPPVMSKWKRSVLYTW